MRENLHMFTALLQPITSYQKESYDVVINDEAPPLYGFAPNGEQQPVPGM